MTEPQVGIIGFGNMGAAIGLSICRYHQVFVFDKDCDKCVVKENISYARSLAELVQKAAVIIFAVKPQDIAVVIDKVAAYSSGKLFISIVAGISTCFLEKKLPSARIIRVMPNLPAQINRGVSAIVKGVSSYENDILLTVKLFSYAGKTIIVDESLINAATAVSGSGPGFYFYLAQGKDQQQRRQLLVSFIPALRKAACIVGFSSRLARISAQETALGAEEYLRQTGICPADAWRKVASKGGTTEAGIAVLKDVNSLTEAVLAARVRAAELTEKISC